MEKFFIVSCLRSGYQLLKTYLSSHPEIFCFGEIFGSDRDIRIKSLFDQPVRVYEEGEDPSKYLDEITYPFKHLSAIGLKINYSDHKNLWFTKITLHFT